MREETKEIVENLYALRAGISLVAEQADFVDKIKEDEARDTADLNLAIEKATSQIEEHKNEFLKKSDGYRNEKINREKVLQEGANLKMPQKITLKTCAIICVVICALVMGVLLIGIADIASTGEIIEIIVGSMIFCALLILMCKALMPTINSDHEKNVLEYEKKKKEYEELLTKNPTTIEKEIEEKINTSRNEMNEKISLQEKKIADVKSLIDITKSNAQSKVTKYTYEGKRIYDSLESQFGHILDTRDWENLDFIIYLLETGRAETIKEALQQLDFHRQTDRIADAVNNANKVICENIQITAQKIQDAVNNSASIISAQLKGIDGRLFGLSINSALQSVFLLKSTLTSNQLLNSAKRLLK